ncbi:hypothetical protein V6N13_014672 [Hibiscus sabdariffa]|uniref:Uncharacterized protein n=1 Tax=Hibiscus sabdariffa TaxID=183260 RepID=A0ABR2RW08_9ROSI
MIWWSIAKWSESNMAIQDLCAYPSHFKDFLINKHNREKKSIWVPPPVGVLKFNIDGVVIGSVGGAEAFKPLVLKFKSLTARVAWKIQHVWREGDALAGSLAKGGISRAIDFCHFA